MTENQILERVQALRAIVGERYDLAREHNIQYWLEPFRKVKDERWSTMQRFQINMSQVFSNGERQVRLDTMNLLLALKENGRPVTLTSANDLLYAELSAWIDWLETPGSKEALDQIVFKLEDWREKLKGLKPLQRPRVYIPEEPVYQEAQQEELVPF
jgi:hypothetical protein